jgi:tetratricopeptide (TPR) repeat protein
MAPVLLAAGALLARPLLPPDALAEAEARLSAGKPAEARALLEGRLAAPDVPGEEASRLKEALGRCLRAEGRPWDAEAAFGEALDLAPGSYGAALGRGEVFLELAAGAAGSRAPSGSEVRALAADAKRWLGAAAKARPAETRPLRGLVRALLLDRDFPGAVESCRALVAALPADAGARHLLAEALRGTGDRAGAAEAEAKCLSLDPSIVEAAARRVGDLFAAGDPAAGREAARAALLRDPAPEDVYRALWEAESPERGWAHVEAVLAAVLEAHPDHPRALHYLGFVRLSAGRWDAALEAFRRRLAKEPGNPRALLQAGRLLVRRQEFAEAESSLLGAFAGLPEGDPERASVLEGLLAIGAAHGTARRFSDAERVFRRLAELDPSGADHRVFLGLSLRRLGRYEEAEAAYREAADLAPFDGVPANELGLLFLGSGRPEEARKAFEDSAARDPRITSPLENLGNLARAAGRFDEAVERFREAHRRAASFRDEEDRIKFRRYLDVVAREREAAAGK